MSLNGKNIPPEKHLRHSRNDISKEDLKVSPEMSQNIAHLSRLAGISAPGISGGAWSNQHRKHKGSQKSHKKQDKPGSHNDLLFGAVKLLCRKEQADQHHGCIHCLCRAAQKEAQQNKKPGFPGNGLLRRQNLLQQAGRTQVNPAGDPGIIRIRTCQKQGCGHKADHCHDHFSHRRFPYGKIH